MRRLSAWIALQALFAVQILSPSPYAFAMRAPQRGDDQAGVEALTEQLHAGAEQPLEPERGLIPLNEAAAAKRLVVLMPEMAEGGIRAFSGLSPDSKKLLKLAVIVRDGHQAEKVVEKIKQLLSPTGFSLEQEVDMEPVFIETWDHLRALGGWLVHVGSQQRWNEWVAQQAGLETQL